MPGSQTREGTRALSHPALPRPPARQAALCSACGHSETWVGDQGRQPLPQAGGTPGEPPLCTHFQSNELRTFPLSPLHTRGLVLGLRAQSSGSRSPNCVIKASLGMAPARQPPGHLGEPGHQRVAWQPCPAQGHPVRPVVKGRGVLGLSARTVHHPQAAVPLSGPGSPSTRWVGGETRSRAAHAWS